MKSFTPGEATHCSAPRPALRPFGKLRPDAWKKRNNTRPDLRLVWRFTTRGMFSELLHRLLFGYLQFCRGAREAGHHNDRTWRSAHLPRGHFGYESCATHKICYSSKGESGNTLGTSRAELTISLQSSSTRTASSRCPIVRGLSWDWFMRTKTLLMRAHLMRAHLMRTQIRLKDDWLRAKLAVRHREVSR